MRWSCSSWEFDADFALDSVEDGMWSTSLFVTLGVCTLTGGLEAVAVTADFKSASGPVISSLDGSSNKKVIAQSVANYWQSDVLEPPSGVEGSFVWTICTRDGLMLMWSVPFFLNNASLYEVSCCEEIIRLELISTVQ